MQRADFTYELPEQLIAYHPTEERTQSRLLKVDAGKSHAPIFSHHVFSNVIDFLQPNDLLVLNNTKVIPARLFAHKTTSGRVEILIERILDDHKVLAHIKASKSPKAGAQLIIALAEDQQVELSVTARQQNLFELELPKSHSVWQLMEAVGHMPLPPYIKREDQLEDQARYQTVYAQNPGAVAAPTAGLHFDENLLQAIQDKGVEIAHVTLHVGAGTFQPVRVDDISEHQMHSERVEVDALVCEKIAQTRKKGGRVIAVGTTVVRCLESAANKACVEPFKGETDIFIYPGYRFKTVDALITNFHLPESTLLMLVSAFVGYDVIQQAYQIAIEQEYRFFSYGDAMFLNAPPSLHFEQHTV